MAQLTITVPDEVVPRIRQALAGVGNPPVTAVQITAQIKAYIKQRVVDYEAVVEAKAKSAAVNGETW